MLDYSKIDWAELREQKESLLWAINKLMVTPGGHQKMCDDLTGILHLIDAIQDDAVDSEGLAEGEVFALTED
jgi:hypothetical protein